MRIFLAVMVWVVFIGLLMMYMKHREHVDYAVQDLGEFNIVEKVYTLEITPSFIIKPDPFALIVDRNDVFPAMVVRLGGHEILKVENPLVGSDTFKVEISRGLVVGENEIFAEANPPADQISSQNALRLRIMESGYPVAEKTLWSPPAAKVSGTFQFTLKHNENNFFGEKNGHK